ncbi:MAG: TonB family protein [Candidatus Nitronauta litoralis]|uniref:TonB family protein n=1 Tax=Candidatus Nitronauta litoralis TaxID=2705533 RepID=A0A7T0G0A9_9BACT|nr:MAG: TonB family protein [Candidatus Nitronauta litoralis]
MLSQKVLSKSFIVSAIGSTALHLVFAMTAGAYFLTREPPPVKNQVKVQIIEKEKPERKEKKERKIKPVVEVAPAIQPVEITQPKQPQQVTQVASVQTKVDVQPVMMESVPTATALPKNAKVTSHVSSRAMTAATSTPRPMRTTAVATMASSSNTVRRKTSNVFAYKISDVAPVKKPTTIAKPILTSKRTGVKRGRAVAKVGIPAPIAVASVNTTQSGTKGAAIKRSSATRVANSFGSPRSVAAPVVTGSSGSTGVGLKKSTARPVQVAGLAPMAQTPVEVIEEVIGEVTDPEAKAGYERKISRRLQYVAQKHFKRSRARKTGKKGKVVISFTLMRDGSVKKVYVKTPNEFASINQVALEALKKAAPFSEFPEGIVGNEFDVTVPFNFYIR